jgi:hypothetical protein
MQQLADWLEVKLPAILDAGAGGDVTTGADAA